MLILPAQHATLNVLHVCASVIESEVTGKDPVEEVDGDEGDEDEGMAEGEEGKEEEDGDLEDAWKMLEFARVIHEKQGSCTIETVDIITKLADVNCFKGTRS
jgi:hypothetical protein